MAATDGALRPDAPLSAHPGAHAFLEAVQRLPGRIFVSWSMAGGLVAGGFLVAASTLTGRSSSNAIPQLTNLYFVVGAGAGLAHGGLLCYLSRDPARTRAQMVGTLIRSLVWLVPGLLLSWVAALWISLTAAVRQGSSPTAFGEVWLTVAWIFGIGVCLWATSNGLRGAIAALRRWPDVRIASVVMSLVFAILVTRFLAAPPEIWFTQFRVTTAGAVILAFGASVWIALPVMIALLGLGHRFFGDA